MLVWRLRNHKEIEILCEELSGVYDKDTIMEMYKAATEEAYSFMFVRLDAKTRRDMFWLRFEARLLPESTVQENDVLQPMGHSEPKTHQIRQPGPGPGLKNKSAIKGPVTQQ